VHVKAAARAGSLSGGYPGEALALKRIQALRKEGLGFDRIAARLNDEGIGRPWNGFVVNRILIGQKG
jgi:hypothetical protein